MGSNRLSSQEMLVEIFAHIEKVEKDPVFPI